MKLLSKKNTSHNVHAIGKIHVLLIYRTGDDEYPAAKADLLFDSSITKVYKAEDVSVLGSIICSGLYKR